MDAIRKKMQSMKAEMDEYTKKIQEYEEKTKHDNIISDKLDADLRDIGKKVQKYDNGIEETMEKLQQSSSKLEEAEKEFKDKDDEVSTLSRRIMLIEEEGRISEEKMANTVLKLAVMSKEADNIVKGCRYWESQVMNNEVDLEEVDGNLREAKKMWAYNETKYDNLARSLAMMEDELKRTDERVKIAETRVVDVESELQNIGENQKTLEVSEEKARQREEKYQEQIKLINLRLKEAESRSEYAEMNISKLHLRIDELEDEIIREKMKINALGNQLDDTFKEMMVKY